MVRRSRYNKENSDKIIQSIKEKLEASNAPVVHLIAMKDFEGEGLDFDSYTIGSPACKRVCEAFDKKWIVDIDTVYKRNKSGSRTDSSIRFNFHKRKVPQWLKDFLWSAAIVAFVIFLIKSN